MRDLFSKFGKAYLLQIQCEFLSKLCQLSLISQVFCISKTSIFISANKNLIWKANLISVEAGYWKISYEIFNILTNLIQRLYCVKTNKV